MMLDEEGFELIDVTCPGDKGPRYIRGRKHNPNPYDTLRLIRDRLEHVMHTKRSTQAWANELPAIHKLIVDELGDDQ